MNLEDFNRYVKLYSQILFRFCLKIVGDHQVTKDVVQDSFLKLWEKGKDLQENQIKSWLFTTAYRFSLAEIKKRSTKVSTDVLSDRVTQPADDPDLKTIINESLSLLSELQKSVMLLKDYQGYDYKEIAQILDISTDSVKVHLFRGRQKIKNRLKSLDLVL